MKPLPPCVVNWPSISREENLVSEKVNYLFKNTEFVY